MTTNQSIFSKRLAETLREQRRAQHLSVLKAQLLRLRAVHDAFNLLTPTLRKAAWFSPEATSVTVGTTWRNLKSFKDERLVALFTKLLAAGFIAERTHDWPHKDTPERDFHFSRTLPGAVDTAIAQLPKASRTFFADNCPYPLSRYEPNDLTIKVTIYAYVKSDSKACRSVLIRTEQITRTEEIREIVCS